MDNDVFYRALFTYQKEDPILACRPNGLFLSNIRSENLEFNLENLNAPPFCLHISESSESFDNIFGLHSYSPAKQEELTAALLGKAEDKRLIALKIANTGLCTLCYYHARPGATEDDHIKIQGIPIKDDIKHLRMRIDCGLHIAYFLELDSFPTSVYSHTTTRRILVTEIIGDQKARRFEHTHTNVGRPASSSWRLIRYSMTPT